MRCRKRDFWRVLKLLAVLPTTPMLSVGGRARGSIRTSKVSAPVVSPPSMPVAWSYPPAPVHLVEFVLKVQDFEATRRFWEDLFGLRFINILNTQPGPRPGDEQPNAAELGRQMIDYALGGSASLQFVGPFKPGEKVAHPYDFDEGISHFCITPPGVPDVYVERMASFGVRVNSLAGYWDPKYVPYKPGGRYQIGYTKTDQAKTNNVIVEIMPAGPGRGMQLNRSLGAVGVNQYKPDGTVISAGSVLPSGSQVVFKATVYDPAGTAVRLYVEVKRLGEAFTGHLTEIMRSDSAPNGTTVTVSSEALAPGSYKWRYRTVDAGNRTSLWSTFGAADAAFVVEGAPVSTLPAKPRVCINEFALNVQDVDATMRLYEYVFDLKPFKVIDVCTPFDKPTSRTVVYRIADCDLTLIGPVAPSTKVEEGVHHIRFAVDGSIEPYVKKMQGYGIKVTDVTGRPWSGGTSDVYFERDGIRFELIQDGVQIGEVPGVVVTRPNGIPSVKGASQYRSDGKTVIPNGGTAPPESTVIFRATVTDPDDDYWAARPQSYPGRVRLEVEVKKIGEAFTGMLNEVIASSFLPSGSTATIVIDGLAETGYKWRYRARDYQGSVSPWVVFGGVTDTAFVVAVQ